MNETVKSDNTKILNRARVLLLIACFGISAATVLIVLGLLSDIFIEVPGRVVDYLIVTGIILSFTGAGQIIYNERLLGPVQAYLLPPSEIKNQKVRDPLVLAGLVLVIWLGLCSSIFLLTIFFAGRGISSLKLFVLEFITGIMVSGTLYYTLKKKVDSSFVISKEAAVYALLRLPLASAFFSLVMWIFAGVFMSLGFHYIVGMSASKSFIIFAIVIGAGSLAFPLQYFIFKRLAEPLRKLLLEKGLLSAGQDFRFLIRYKLSWTMLGLVIFTAGVMGALSYNKSTRILKLQAEQLLTGSLEAAFPNNENLSRETITTRLNSLKNSYGVIPFVLTDDAVDPICTAPPAYTDLLTALAGGDENKIKLLRGDDLVVKKKIGRGSVRAGLIYPYKNLLPFLDEVRNKAVIFGLLTVIIALSLSFLASRDISRPMEIMKEEAGRFTSGDYSWRDGFFSDDESADLALGFRAMSNEIVLQMEQVRSLIENIELTVHHLGTSASELEAIAREQAAGSAEQAAAIQEALTTAGEIAATARQIAENALTVNNVASESRDACENSKKVVSTTIGGIEEVRNHVNVVARGTLDLAQFSQRIQGIVDIIEEINEQTHLLSVNASIEASGAGEEGRRFAVLAREIRRLAEGTVEATEQIKSLVKLIQKSTTSTVMMAEESTKVVASWAGHVGKLGEAFSTISALVEMATNATGEIRISTQQQTTACEQMAQVIAEVKEVADQVVTSSRETEKSMADLTELTAKLKEIVVRKHTKGDQPEC